MSWQPRRLGFRRLPRKLKKRLGWWLEYDRDIQRSFLRFTEYERELRLLFERGATEASP
jgi:hypothetical protein